jgi:Fe-S-cluster containining protein
MQRAQGTYRPDLVEDATSWEGKVLKAQAVSTAAIIIEGRTEEKTLELAQNAFEWLDRLTENFYAEFTPQLDCKEGCSYCCSVPVDVSAPEVFAIVDCLKATKSVDDIHALRHRIDEYLNRHSDMSPKERRRARVACPLLENNECSIYRARPLACRGWNSYDVERCRRDFEAPLQIALDTEDALEQWLSGEAVFRDAEETTNS